MVVDLVTVIVKSLVDDPEAVNINILQGESCSIIEVDCAPDDIGKVIGVGGRTATAIRTIMNCVGRKENRRYLLQVNG